MTTSDEDQETRTDETRTNPLAVLVIVTAFGTGIAYGVLALLDTNMHERLYYTIGKLAIVLPIITAILIASAIVSRRQAGVTEAAERRAAARLDDAERRTSERMETLDECHRVELAATVGELTRRHQAEMRAADERHLRIVEGILASQGDREELAHQRGLAEQYAIGKAQADLVAERHQAELERVKVEAERLGLAIGRARGHAEALEELREAEERQREGEEHEDPGNVTRFPGDESLQAARNLATRLIASVERRNAGRWFEDKSEDN